MITNFLDGYGTVVSVAYDKCTSKGFEGVATGVRSVVMTGNPKDVPHVMTVCHPKTNQTYKFLLTVRGHKPLCLRCRQEGHYKRDCFNPFCHHHGEYGHSTEICSATKTYMTKTILPILDESWQLYWPYRTAGVLSSHREDD